MTKKVALLTGATGGIGQACARRLVASGMAVVLVDLDMARLDKLARETGGDTLCLTADVADEQQSSSCVQAALARYGRIDQAFLNAGIEGPAGLIGQTPVEAFDRVMQVNVRGVWLGLAHLMPAMASAGGGSIVVTSSIAGLRGSARLAPYVASKHAVIGLMKCAAIEGAAQHIRVNAVCPGAVDTRMMEAIEAGANPASPGAVRAAIEAGIPQQRYADPDEVAAMMCFIAGSEAGYCTGSVFTIDGGAMAGAVR
ncbi:SDR family NAD(P)-dependent oxidoreductase [Caenimonas sp. SL110]|uniref:SDR family NAD(P)-dependent oxidoreductase n=1 Tax=Caenimonas sp. SL110 TaxID=1450524 RepID=UPI0006537B9A|nr:SDR family NAD(P)-dependent oxidoreductase [Caenimonas sp. SL110]